MSRQSGDNPRRNVCSEVAERNLCIGCGACAAACPKGKLSIDWNDLGCYVVTENGADCAPACSVCLRTCPFHDSNPNEDTIAQDLFGGISEIEHQDEMGYYQSCFAGHIQDECHRLRSASGGIAVWFLSELLRRGEVDHVMCVAPGHGPRPLHEYVVCSTIEEVELTAGSSYYPVEMSRVVRRILDKEGRYAITCLPCFAKSLRLLSRVYPQLKERLVCVVGLVCGHTASSFFSEYVAALADERAGPPERLAFRKKDSRYPASELGMECGWSQGERKTVFWSQGIADAWVEHWFTPNPCLYCDDVFAEVADISLMDAWHPKYIADYRGTNMTIVRSRLANDTVQSGIDSHTLSLDPCSANDIMRSQYPVVRNKTDGLAHRLWVAGREGLPVPVKRVSARREPNLLEAARWRRRMWTSAVGCREWLGRSDLAGFRSRLGTRSGVERVDTAARAVATTLLRILRRITRMVAGRKKS